MPDFTGWLGVTAGTIDAERRASHAWHRINRKPTEITLARGNTDIAAQIVRIEYNSDVSDSRGEVGVSSKIILTIFGVKDHATVADANIQRGDRLTHNGHQFKVIDVVENPGDIQARAEAGS